MQGLILFLFLISGPILSYIATKIICSGAVGECGLIIIFLGPGLTILGVVLGTIFMFVSTRNNASGTANDFNTGLAIFLSIILSGVTFFVFALYLESNVGGLVMSLIIFFSSYKLFTLKNV